MIVLLLISITRLWGLASTPYGINQDEAYAGYEAFSLLKYGFDSWGLKFPVYFISWGSGMNVLYSYLLIPFFYLLGCNIFVLRLPQALCGIFACYVFYRILRLFYKKREALIGFFVVGIMPWGIMYSRFGLEANLLPLFYLLGFYFCLRAFKNNNYILLSALFYAISMYAYATGWIFVIFTMLIQYSYFVYMKHNKIVTIKTFLALGTFGLLVLPLFLFWLVNNGYINEIKTSFFSVPKLVYWRANEIGFNHFGMKFQAFIRCFVYQNDTMRANALPQFGAFYHLSLIFGIIGLWVLVKRSYTDLRDKKVSFSFLVLMNIIVGVVYSLMLFSTINRLNFLWYFMIMSIIIGVLLFRRKIQLCILLVYLVMFVKFISFYFTEYNKTWFTLFRRGINEALVFINENPKYKYKPVYFVGLDDVHSSVLFLTQYPTDEFYKNVEWMIYPNAYLDARKFGKYHFIKEFNYDKINNDAIYVFSKWDKYMAANFSQYVFREYVVAIPRRIL